MAKAAGPAWKQFLTAQARGIPATAFAHVDTVAARPSVLKKILSLFPERMVLTRIPGSSPAVGSPHDFAYSLDQLGYCGRHLGGQLRAEAEVAANYGKDR